MAPLFSAYVAVDWSASSKPTSGKDSIWIRALGDGVDVLENVATRAAATERVREILRMIVSTGGRALVGFDFPYGYPAGTADAIAPRPGDAWKKIWDTLALFVRDDDRNGSNRLLAGAELNERIGAPTFWGWPAPDDRLPQKKPPPARLPEWRAVEGVLRGRRLYPKSVWQLSGAGCVGSQALVGIPRIRALRGDARLESCSRVWPFESIADAAVVHAEIWPGALPVDYEAHPIPDAAQVMAVVSEFSRRDRSGALLDLLEVPMLPHVREEGWILGV